jgi:hypothetical protein
MSESAWGPLKANSYTNSSCSAENLKEAMIVLLVEAVVEEGEGKRARLLAPKREGIDKDIVRGRFPRWEAMVAGIEENSN